MRESSGPAFVQIEHITQVQVINQMKEEVKKKPVHKFFKSWNQYFNQCTVKWL